MVTSDESRSLFTARNRPLLLASLRGWLYPRADDCIAYIDKLAAFGTNLAPGQVVISASVGGYPNTNFVLDGIRHGYGYGPSKFDLDYSASGGKVSEVAASLSDIDIGVNSAAIHFFDGLETLTNDIQYNLVHPSGFTNIAGYMTWGVHSSLFGDYARVSSKVQWGAGSGWYIITTIESFNGWRDPVQRNFTQWFSSIAFGGTNYSNTPVGAVTHTDEPLLVHVADGQTYFGLWVEGRSFAKCAWAAARTPHTQAVGDALVAR